MFLLDANNQDLGFVSHLGLDSLPLLRNDESEKNERDAEILNMGKIIKFRIRVSSALHLRVEIL